MSVFPVQIIRAVVAGNRNDIIPCIIVINSEGIIVSRDKQSEALVKDVDEVMAAYKPMAAVVPAAEELADTVAAF